MPIPKPTSGESQQDFISRCMGNDAMQEYDQDQRAAICYQTWKDSKGKSLTPDPFAPKMPSAYRTYVARHGVTDYNGMGDSAERIRGHIDVPLADEGREQATAMGKSLKDSGIGMLFTSDLSRAHETANLMAKEMGNIPVLAQSGLRPWKFGQDIEGHPVSEIQDKIDYLIDHPDEHNPDGESFHNFRDRFMGTFKRIQSDYANQTIGIVTHYRGLKMLDGYNAGGKTGEIDKEAFRTKDTSCPPGSYRCMDKNGDLTDEKSMSVPSVMYRNATIEEKAISADSGQVLISVSSDEPYERSFGTEILDHSPGSIRLDRMNKGAPLLFNHDPNIHIGRVLTARTDGKQIETVTKFSSSPIGKEKFQDVKDGILREASIGYAIYKMEEEKPGVFRATDWEPYEASLVTIPADTSVGIGRALVRVHSPLVDRNKITKPMPEPIVQEPPPKIDVRAEQEKALADYQSRQKKIFEYVKAIKNDNWRAIAHATAMKHTVEGGAANFDEFRSEYLNSIEKVEPSEVPDTKLGMSKKERRQFSVLKLIRDIAYNGAPAGLEKEACEAHRAKLDKWGDNRTNHDGYSLPDDIVEANMAEDHDLDTRGLRNVEFELRQLNRNFTRNLAASTGSTGGFLIGVDLLTGSIIELLRNKALVMNLGPTLLGGLVNNIAIPRVITGSTVYWLAEGAAVTESDQSFGQLALTPHRLGIDTAYTKQLVNQASLSVEAFVRDDMARQGAVERDRVFINGGVNAGEPLGILNTPGVQSLTFGAAATWAKMVQFETDIEGANAILGPMAYLTTPSTKNKLKTNPKVGTQFPIFIWEAGDVPMINGVTGGLCNGYPIYATKNMPANQVLFGVWSELIIADWAGVDVVVDPYSLKKQEQVEVTMHQWLDVGVRHPVAFEFSTDGGNQ